MTPASTSLLAVFLAVAVWHDARWRTIPNWLTLGGSLAGFFLTAAGFGLAGWFNHITSAGLLGGVWYLFWRLHWLGGGDQKLLCMVGAYVDYTLVVPIILSVAVCGALQALGTAFIRCSIVPSLSYGQALKHTILPYSFAIATGTLLAIFMWWG